jgi:uracil-DNA glycosylase family 4
MEKQKLLNELKEKMKADKTLPLRSGATNLVFGDGSPDAEILFIGEGPGYWEDVKGIPFVGNAGALLNQLLVKIGIQRKDVYITNIIHFRAPENRDPESVEINAFKKYLDEIIRIIDPKIIVTLGRFSMAKFLPGVFISSVHGKEKVIEWEGKQITVVPMYHPAAALRSSEVKLKLTMDFEKLPEILKNIKEKGVRIGSVDKVEEKVEQMNLI